MRLVSHVESGVPAQTMDSWAHSVCVCVCTCTHVYVCTFVHVTSVCAYVCSAFTVLERGN